MFKKTKFSWEKDEQQLKEKIKNKDIKYFKKILPDLIINQEIPNSFF